MLKQIENTQLGQKMLVLLHRQSLSKDISKLVLCGNIGRIDDLGLQLISNVMTVNLYMFGPFMKQRIMSNM